MEGWRVDRATSIASSPVPAGRRSRDDVVRYPEPVPWLQISAVFHVFVSMALVGLVLMHSGRDAGLGGMGFTPASQGGTHIVERNLTRLTVVIAVIFFLNTIALFHLLK
jgi:preprotein translocase subunit SecG